MLRPKEGLGATLLPVTISAIASITTGSASAAVGALLTGARLIDGKLAPLEIFSIEGGRRRFGFSDAGHGDKRKSAGTSGHPVQQEVDIGNLAVFREQFFEVCLSG
jgi:hypothetical protein